eukprot:4227996-Prorocentrum_lima.AAC.1
MRQQGVATPQQGLAWLSQQQGGGHGCTLYGYLQAPIQEAWLRCTGEYEHLIHACSRLSVREADDTAQGNPRPSASQMERNQPNRAGPL